MSTEGLSEIPEMSNSGIENMSGNSSHDLQDEIKRPAGDDLREDVYGQTGWQDLPDISQKRAEIADKTPPWKDVPTAPTDMPPKRPDGEWKDDFWGDNDGRQKDVKSDDPPEVAAQNETNENQPESNENSKLSQNTDGVQDDELQELKEEYIDDIIENSEVPETIDEEKAKSAEYEKCSVEETAEKRAEFNKIKDSLIEEWEEKTGKKWPTYQEDVYSSNGSLIRRAGDKYDAHHIQPLSMGGKNEAGNITPLHAECHYDRQGVHSPDSAYAKLEQKLGA